MGSIVSARQGCVQSAADAFDRFLPGRGRTLAAELAPLLDDWTAAEPMVAGLHSGDVGWHLRHDDERLASAFRLWSVDGAPAAVALVEETLMRTAVAPTRVGDTVLAEAMAQELEGVDYVDAPSGGALRTFLLRSGWVADPDPWILLHKELDALDAAFEDPGTSPLSGAADVEARVAVQRSAFAPGSTFTPELWERGPRPVLRRALRAAHADTDRRARRSRDRVVRRRRPLRDPRARWHASRPPAAGLRTPGESGRDVGPRPSRRERDPCSQARVNEAAVKAYESCGLAR